ncbi:MAG: translation elongation factor [Clostridia bacterium]|nr:translation elongation factor [Clostridia bacterium]
MKGETKMQYPVIKLRNVCLLGHGGDGKTSLAEAMLFYTKCIDRLGKVSEGNTACDFDAEEIKRKISISTAIAPVEWNSYKINVIDTPGYFDFEGEVLQGLRAAESAVITVSAKDGVNVGTEKAFKLSANKDMPTIFFISKMDEENSDFNKVYASLKEKFGSSVCAIALPIIEDGKLNGFIDLIDMKAKRIDNGKETEIPIPSFMNSIVGEMKNSLNEALAETDEKMLDKYFAGEEFTADEIKTALTKGIKERSLIPVLSGSAYTLAGMQCLLNFIIEYTPCPVVDEKAQTALLIFKTIADPFVGKMSFFKILSGNVKQGMTLSNINTETQEKLGHVFVIRGKKQTEAEELGAGDIGVVTKLQNTSTGNLLCSPGFKFVTEPLEYPKPCLSMAIVPKSKGDEEKISQGLQRLAEEDLTFTYVNNAETHEQIINGMGEMHVDVLISKLKAKFGVSVELKAPRIPYREAIRKKVKQQGKHKKQSGGHGQYGDVWIEFEPYEGQELLFEEKIFGGSVPKNFHPAVEKGLRECAAHGILAGYPVVGLKATLVDGSYHDVDSSEMSFKLAANIAFKEGLKNANPTILEPVYSLKVTVPDNMMGDIIGDINKRRGQIMGMIPSNDAGIEEVVAEVPLSEMASYAIDLRSMTRGRGSFEMEFVRYQDAPPNIAQQVIEDAKKPVEAEE